MKCYMYLISSCLTVESEKKSSKINFLYSKTWTDQINVIYSKNELTNIDQSKNLFDN